MRARGRAATGSERRDRVALVTNVTNVMNHSIECLGSGTAGYRS